MEALQLHWHRCLWVLGLWHASTDEIDIDLPGKHIIVTNSFLSVHKTSMHTHTHTHTHEVSIIFISISNYKTFSTHRLRLDYSETLDVMWDVPQNIQKVKELVEYVLSGCKCKTGCGTMRCKCRKSGRSCCHCHGFVNVPNSNGESETNNLEDTVAVRAARVHA